MCMPDVGPCFDHIVSAFRNLGGMVNGWFNMVYVVLVLGGDSPCPPGLDLASAFADATWRNLSGGNQSVVVRLTDTLFARTDGAMAMYVSHRSQVAYSYAAWPRWIDTSFGVAAVQLPPGSISSVGMLGCVCADGPGGVSISCTVLSPEESWTLPVQWQLATAPKYLSCSRLRVVVQSLRWPDYRVSLASKGIVGSCVLDGSCLSADAIVYAIPVCGGNGTNGLACIPGNAFIGSNCFPYCMALRLRGSGVFVPMIMRGASSWSTGVLLADRNCAPVSGVSDISSSGGSGGSVHCDFATASIVTNYASDSTSNCSLWRGCSTFLQDRAQVMGGFKRPVVDQTDSGLRIVLSGQPLVVAGGVNMRLAASVGSTVSQYFSVDFPHLVGDETNAFTMEVSITAGVPSSPPPPVPSLNLEYERLGMIDVPPVDVDRKQWYNPATVTPGKPHLATF